MSLSVIQVDAFASHPFQGNPAAVCVTQAPLADDLMQSIAMEMNLSETAFLYPADHGFSLRWFTPTVEVALCGHATLASAHVLWSEGHLAVDQMARFQTKSGLLMAQKQGDWIQLDFPAQPVHDTTVMPQLVSALNHADIQHVARNQTNLLVELRPAKAMGMRSHPNHTLLTTLTPNFEKLKTLPVQGVIVTCQGDGHPYDFVSRYFAPAAGIPEDPVTGSAHCALVPYWQAKLGKERMLAYQASARGGVLKVQMQGDRVYLSGQAVTVMRGELSVPTSG
jgi:PhzF family phenazine biosynthesis protein